MCKNCLQLLEKHFNFHKRCVKSENIIWTHLQDKSDDFKKNFKLFGLFQEDEKEKNQAQNDVHDDLHIDDKEHDKKRNKNDLNIIEKSRISTQSVHQTTEAKEQDIHISKKMLISKDNLLEQLDTAILSCEDTLSQSNAQHNNKRKSLPDDLNDLIEEVDDLSDEINSSNVNTNKPYNTRNKRKKIVVDTYDNVAQDPDFKVDNNEDESDEDYVEGSETFGWMPKSR